MKLDILTIGSKKKFKEIKHQTYSTSRFVESVGCCRAFTAPKAKPVSRKFYEMLVVSQCILEIRVFYNVHGRMNLNEEQVKPRKYF